MSTSVSLMVSGFKVELIKLHSAVEARIRRQGKNNTTNSQSMIFRGDSMNSMCSLIWNNQQQTIQATLANVKQEKAPIICVAHTHRNMLIR